MGSNLELSFSSNSSFWTKATVKPDDCDSEEECDWMCTNFFEGGEASIELLTYGGVSADDYEFDMEGEGKAIASNRLLQEDSEWEPEKGDSGTAAEAEFEADFSDSSDSDSAMMMLASFGTVIS